MTLNILRNMQRPDCVCSIHQELNSVINDYMWWTKLKNWSLLILTEYGEHRWTLILTGEQNWTLLSVMVSGEEKWTLFLMIKSGEQSWTSSLMMILLVCVIGIWECLILFLFVSFFFLPLWDPVKYFKGFFQNLSDTKLILSVTRRWLKRTFRKIFHLRVWTRGIQE